jgi:hypothetical protein
MPEATPKDQGETPEIDGLIADLELQIEGLTAGLNKLRGTVARLSYASLAARLVAVPATSAGSSGVQADAPEVPAGAPSPMPMPNWLPAPAYQQDPDAPEVQPEAGFWDSVAEGASWPRSRSVDDPETPAEATSEAAPSEGGEGLEEADATDVPASRDWAMEPMRAEGLVEALKATAADSAWDAMEPYEGAETETLGWPPAASQDPALAGPTEDPSGSPPAAKAEPPGENGSTAWQAAASLVVEPSSETEDADAPAAAADATPTGAPASIWERWQAAAPNHAPQHTPSISAAHDAADPAGDGPSTETEPVDGLEPEANDSAENPLPKALSFGWPDESIWSQSFEWPAMKPKDPPPSRNIESDPTRAGVSEIVAQVRAELEGAQDLAGTPPTGSEDASADREGVDVSSDPWSTSLPAEGLDDDAGNDNERVTAAADRTSPFIEGATDPAASLEAEVAELVPLDAGGAGALVDTHGASGIEQDDATRRDEVSRAVEEIRRQIESGGLQAVMREEGIGDTSPGSAAIGQEEVQGEKPAFRLAAPGALPDWSHVPLEPMGPPVVVIKDPDGRVELASVYEALNELGCGDGAALLNYTPHSVTVGLPVSARFPTTGQISDAVEKVFGLTARVESDGVRVTVSIGVDPKRRSVGAA